MGNYETFSKRKKRLANAGKTEIYQYEDLPDTFRVQVVYIWRDALGRFYIPGDYSSVAAAASNIFWETIHDTIAKETGLFYLGKVEQSIDARCVHYLQSASTEGALDIIELSFRVIDRFVRKKLPDLYPQGCGICLLPDAAIEDLNHRFKEHGIGYQYGNGILFQIDSQFLHAEAVKPALTLLNTKGFEGPAQEFMDAFDHFRHGKNKEAADAALKSFESTMKAICAKRKWTYDSKATAKPLLDILITKGLIPISMESHFTGLRVAMESGLPTIRNTSSGHGQGPVPRELPEHFAAYALHLLAANIVFLIEAEKVLK